MIRELQPGIVINNRASLPGDLDTPECHLGDHQAWRDWLKLNGESLYGTRGGPWKPGVCGGSTRRGNTTYVHRFQGPASDMVLPAVPGNFPVFACNSR